MTQVLIKKSNISGGGLFVQEDVPAKHIILEFKANPITTADLPNFKGNQAALLQIGPELYLNLEGHNSYFINHACFGFNCAIKITTGKAFLVSVKSIKAGDELTFDYSTTSTDDPSTWSMKCSCDLFRCRGLITGFQSLPEGLRQKYISMGIVPHYLGGK